MIIKAVIPELYRSLDMNGTIVDCGERYAEKLGYESVADALGSSFFDHSPASARKDLIESFDYWKRTGDVTTSKRIQLEAKNGDVTDVILTLTNRYEDGELVGRDGVMREVEHIERIQKTYNVHARPGYDDPDILRRSVNYMGVIIDCNQSYLDNMGYSRDEVIGTSLYTHTASRSVGNLATNMENWRAGIRTKSKIWMRRKYGTEFPVMLQSTDETDEEGTIIGRTVSLTRV